MTMAMTRTSETGLPAHIQAALAAGDSKVNDSLKGYVSPPRVKTIQPLTKAPLSELFVAGDSCLLPMQQLLAKRGTAFSFVPIFFYPEYISCNPNGVEPFIRERTLDKSSELAAKCRDPKRREEAVNGDPDPKKRIKNREVLVFLVAIVGHESLTGVVASMSFSSGEYRTGTNLTSALKMRGIPMFGTVWNAKAGNRTNSKGAWWGYDITPVQEAQGLVDDEAAFNTFRELNREFHEAYLESRIVVDLNEEADAGAPDSGEPSTEY